MHQIGILMITKLISVLGVDELATHAGSLTVFLQYLLKGMGKWFTFWLNC